MEAKLHELPSINELTDHIKLIDTGVIRRVRVYFARQCLKELRAQAKAGHNIPSLDTIAGHLKTSLEELTKDCLKRVINATGVVLHTNLGRSPLGSKVMNELALNMAGYSNLEFDLQSGKRGSRTGRVERLIAALSGSEDALIVNNNAAAVMLALHGMAKGGLVAVSRGELVQIGGGFRIPEVLEASGAKLLEVGSTNITETKDFEKVCEQVSALLKVHHSNFMIIGHTGSVSIKELSEIAKKHKRPLIVDLGSGFIEAALLNEVSVNECIRDHADLVCFSGDKLLGASQAGIVIGGKTEISLLKATPLYRALRISKLELFVLERTLLGLATGEDPLAVKLIHTDLNKLEVRACNIKNAIGHSSVNVCSLQGSVGGGAMPGLVLNSCGLVIHSNHAEAIVSDLRKQDPPVICLLRDKRACFDLRTVLESEDLELGTLIRQVISCM